MKKLTFEELKNFEGGHRPCSEIAWDEWDAIQNYIETGDNYWEVVAGYYATEANNAGCYY
jgi:hypothetical protein